VCLSDALLFVRTNEDGEKNTWVFVHLKAFHSLMIDKLRACIARGPRPWSILPVICSPIVHNYAYSSIIKLYNYSLNFYCLHQQELKHYKFLSEHVPFTLVGLAPSGLAISRLSSRAGIWQMAQRQNTTPLIRPTQAHPLLVDGVGLQLSVNY
jgi:hypothetical protein